MRVCYVIQNHLEPAFAARLIEAIRLGSSDPFILIAHDPYAGFCETDDLKKALDDVDVFEVTERPHRGYFSLLQPWFDAVSWLSSNSVAYDWLVYLSAQDYPTQPLRSFERMLATSGYDGFLRFWDARARITPWGRRKQGIYRYFYQYFDAGEWLMPAMRFIRALNRYQPLMHTHLVFGPRIGFRMPGVPFNSEYICYAGKQWTVLSRECAEFVFEEASRREAVMRWFHRTVCPDEAVVQTLLVNAGKFRLKNDDLRYVDFSGSLDGHPRMLTIDDLPVITDESIWFARKIDAIRDPDLVERLEEHINPKQP